MKDRVSIIRPDLTISWPSSGTASHDTKMIAELLAALGPVAETPEHPVGRVFDQQIVTEIWQGGYAVGFRHGKEES